MQYHVKKMSHDIRFKIQENLKEEKNRQREWEDDNLYDPSATKFEGIIKILQICLWKRHLHHSIFKAQVLCIEQREDQVEM